MEDIMNRKRFEKRKKVAGMFDHKLYRKYYPLMTRESLRSLIQDDSLCFKIESRNALYHKEALVNARELDFFRQMRYPFTVFGEADIKKVVDNRKLLLEKESDPELCRLLKEMEQTEELVEKAACRTLSVEEGNQLLEAINEKHRYMVRDSLLQMLLMATVVVCVLIWMGGGQYEYWGIR